MKRHNVSTSPRSFSIEKVKHKISINIYKQLRIDMMKQWNKNETKTTKKTEKKLFYSFFGFVLVSLFHVPFLAS